MKHKMYYLHRAASVVLLAALFAGAGCKSNNNKPAAQSASVAKPSPSPPRRLIRKAGWEIPGLVGAKEDKVSKLLPVAGNAKVYSTLLSPSPKPRPAGQPGKIDDLPTLRSYLSEEEREKLGITAKKLYVMSMVRYELGDRPFCYVVKYRARYAIEALHYYDEDGDKNFELVESGTPDAGTAFSKFVPRIPEWAQQQH
jgi:hypothetical protein